MIFVGGLFIQMVLVVADGETFSGWGVISRSPHRYPYLLNARSTTRERGNDYREWQFTQMVVLALLMVKLLLDGV